MRHGRTSILVLFFLVSAFAASGQTPVPGGGQTARPGTPPPGAQVPGMPPRDSSRAATPTGTARIRGRVVASDTGAALRRAQVSLTGGNPPSLVRKGTTTDAEGRFEFAELPAGSYSVVANKTGYVSLQYGQRRPYEAGTPISINDGQVVERIDFGLPRGGVIVVRVTDDFGEPLAGAQVQVQRYQYQPDGQRRLVTATSGVSGLNGTDDRGEMRVFGLMPGEYIVSASFRALNAPGGNDTGEGFSPTYFPGVAGADQATPISVRIGEEASVPLAMTASRLVRITGMVVNSEGRPASGAQLTLTTRSGNGFFSSPAGIVNADGSFTISGVTPGEHTIDIRPRGVLEPTPTGSGETASMPVTVGGADITNLRIVTGRGAIISGRVVWEGTSPRDLPGGLPIQPRVGVQQADPSKQMLTFPSNDPLSNGSLDDNGNFQLAGGVGTVFFNFPTPPGWVMKSVMLDGRNIIDEPLDLTGRATISDVVITMSDKLTSLSGQVADGRGQLSRDYVVVILPSEQLPPVVAARRTRLVRPNTEGRFETRGLRPGKYVATAVETLEQGRQFAPEYQQQLRQAIGAREFSVGEGQSVSVDLRLTPDL